jgi:hypothetical protein
MSTLANLFANNRRNRSGNTSKDSNSHENHPTLSSDEVVDGLDIYHEHGSPAGYSPGSIISLPDLPDLPSREELKEKENSLSDMNYVNQAISTIEITKGRYDAVRDSSTKYLK